LEYIIYDFFTQFCGRTFDPEKADFFYLPIVRDVTIIFGCFYIDILSKVEYRFEKEVNNNKFPSPTENALLEAMEKNLTKKWKETFQISDYYWNRNLGSDHIIVMPAPVTNFRHEASRRGFFHYMPQLHRPIFINIGN
jgi:hypothetical protein